MRLCGQFLALMEKKSSLTQRSRMRKSHKSRSKRKKTLNTSRSYAMSSVASDLAGDRATLNSREMVSYDDIIL